MDKGIGRFPKHHHNPFLTDLIIPFSRKSVGISKDQLVVSEEGEISDSMARMVLSKNVDCEPFTKLFSEFMPWPLTPRALYVFHYMISCMEMNSTLIRLNPSEAINENLHKLEYKNPTPIYNALDELIEKEFIAKSLKSNYYWINPKYVYNGNRMNVKKVMENSQNVEK